MVVPVTAPTNPPTPSPSLPPAAINATTTVTTCAGYTAANTNNAQQNTATCLFYACPGQTVAPMCTTYSGSCSVRILPVLY